MALQNILKQFSVTARFWKAPEQQLGTPLSLTQIRHVRNSKVSWAPATGPRDRDAHMSLCGAWEFGVGSLSLQGGGGPALPKGSQLEDNSCPRVNNQVQKFRNIFATPCVTPLPWSNNQGVKQWFFFDFSVGLTKNYIKCPEILRWSREKRPKMA